MAMSASYSGIANNIYDIVDHSFNEEGNMVHDLLIKGAAIFLCIVQANCVTFILTLIVVKSHSSEIKTCR